MQKFEGTITLSANLTGGITTSQMTPSDENKMLGRNFEAYLGESSLPEIFVYTVGVKA